MKQSGKEKVIAVKKNNGIKAALDKYTTSIVLSALFIFSALYFYLFGTHIFFYQENFSMFIFSSDYLHQFSVKPGGLLEYAGNFLTQGYFNTLYGSLVLAIVFTVLAITFLNINKKISTGKTFALPFAVLPSSLFLIMQTNFNWRMLFNLGFLLVALFFLFSISSDKKSRQLLVLLLLPLFYYLVGAFAWLYLAMIVVYQLYNRKIIFPVFLLSVALISFLAFKELIFLQPYKDLIRYPLPLQESTSNPLYIYIILGFIICYPVIQRISSKIRINEENTHTLSRYGVVVIFSLTFFVQSRQYDPKVVDLFRLEKLFYQQDWIGVIKLQEKIQSQNIVAQYYYNIALSEKNILCDRMFFSRQDFGTQSIMIPWSAGTNINKIFRGAYFFYTIGLINEAHRWAYESMVVQGFQPENTKLLIKTELINGHYEMAERYINIFRNTFHYRSWVSKYGAMLHHPDLISADPELGAKIKLQPKTDFPIRIKNPQANINLILNANPENRVAFEYKLGWYMLEKNVNGIIDEIKKMKAMGYTRLPRHIEEAAVFANANIGTLTDLGGMKVDSATIERFSQYESTMMLIQKSTSTGNPDIKNSIRYTFWYYLDWK